MAQCSTSSPTTIFGIHEVTFYDRCTGEHFGRLEVLSGSSLSLTGELIQLNGGSSPYAFDVQRGLISAEATISFSEYAPFLDEILLGKAPTEIAAEAAGNVSAVANKNGSSIVDVANGIDAVEATTADEADLKFAKYVIVATGAATFDVYASSSVDFARGTDATYLSGTKIIEGADVSAGDYVSAEFGLTFSSIGTPAFTVGDTATFEVRPIHSGAFETVVGGLSDVYPEFGMIVVAARGSNLYEIDMYRGRASGMPHNFSANEFSEAEVTAQFFYDPNRSGVFSKRVIPL